MAEKESGQQGKGSQGSKGSPSFTRSGEYSSDNELDDKKEVVVHDVVSRIKNEDNDMPVDNENFFLNRPRR